MRGKRLTLPPGPVVPAKLADIAAQYAALVAEEQKLRAQLRRRKQTVREAERADTELAATAALEDGEHPGTPNADQVDEALDTARSRQAGVSRALDALEVDVQAICERHRESWIEDAAANLEEARTVYEAAVSTMARTRAAFHEAWRIHRWAAEAPSRRWDQRARSYAAVDTEAAVAALTGEAAQKPSETEEPGRLVDSGRQL